MEQLQFNFTLEQANVILKALDNMPYGQVCELVQQVHQQAGPQLNKETANSSQEPSFIQTEEEPAA